jgi:transcriptional regulator with XRE-family HTH domain
MVFVMRKLDRVPQTLGEKLRALRRGQAVSLVMLEESTHIQRRYLEALERGRYDALPEPLYTRNFIKGYARALGADETYFLELYEEESGRTDLLAPHRLPRERMHRVWLFSPAKFLKFVSFILIGLTMLGYFAWQIDGLLRPPHLVIDTPIDGLSAQNALVEVRGSVENDDVMLTVNGRQVVVNDDKTFVTTVDLTRGLNVITVEGAKRYSRKAIEYRRVVFDASIPGDQQGISQVSYSGE